MDHKLKLKALQKLAETEGESIISVLSKEADKLENILRNECKYFALEEALEQLDAFAFRLSDKAIELSDSFLSRLKTIELTFDEVTGMSEPELAEYYDAVSLTNKTLEILEHIRYFDIPSILDILLRYSIDNNVNVRNTAAEGLESLAKYNLDILYGSDNNQPYGPFAQIEILNELESFRKDARELYFHSIVSICKALLSPVVMGTSFSSKSMTWKTASIQADEHFSDIRKRTLDLLEAMYAVASNTNQKLSIINTMYSVIHTPHMGKYSEELIELIYSNVMQLLRFYQYLLGTESLQIVQKIEHHVFWIFRHRSTDSIRKSALEIRNLIEQNQEYQIYKILVGFEGVFEDWELEDESKAIGYEEERDFRSVKAFEFADVVKSDNYEEWSERIMLYARIESDDLATFPYFGKFLERIGEKSPDIALRLIADNLENLERFFLAILLGLWRGNKKAAKVLINKWIRQGENLFTCARIFEYNSELDEEMVNSIFVKAVENKDTNTFIQIISSLSANYDESNRFIIDTIFNSIDELTKLENTNWVNALWFRKEKNKILTYINDEKIDVILNNLLLVDSLDFHVEEMLSPIATNNPEKVIEFFGKRLKYKEDNELDSRYDAIPFDIYELNKPLSKIPEKAVEIVSDWYDSNYGLFTYAGANLLKIIFPDFPKPFENKLTKLVQTGDVRNIEIVISVLRNYEGQSFLHNICKDLIMNMPDEKESIDEIIMILNSTGTVSGEYGFANAFAEKREEIKEWLEEKNDKVRRFAEKYDEILRKRVEWETKKSDEEIALRKYKYGES